MKHIMLNTADSKYTKLSITIKIVRYNFIFPYINGNVNPLLNFFSGLPILFSLKHELHKV